VASHGSWIPVENDGKTSVNKKTKFTRVLSLAVFFFFFFWIMEMNLTQHLKSSPDKILNYPLKKEAKS
jgi:hypothetical protein